MRELTHKLRQTINDSSIGQYVNHSEIGQKFERKMIELDIKMRPIGERGILGKRSIKELWNMRLFPYSTTSPQLEKAVVENPSVPYFGQTVYQTLAIVRDGIVK